MIDQALARKARQEFEDSLDSYISEWSAALEAAMADPTENAFCATGEGGGQDPHCSPNKDRRGEFETKVGFQVLSASKVASDLSKQGIPIHRDTKREKRSGVKVVELPGKHTWLKIEWRNVAGDDHDYQQKSEEIQSHLEKEGFTVERPFPDKTLLAIRRKAAISNAFCPTGEKGGIDPHCSPSGAKAGIFTSVGSSLMSFFRGARELILRQFRHPAAELDPGTIKAGSYLSHKASVESLLGSLGVHDAWTAALRKSPILRAKAVSSPALFDGVMAKLRNHFDQAVHFADHSDKSRLMRDRGREIQELCNDVAAFRSRVTPEVPSPIKGTRGASAKNILHAAEHLSKGGTVNSAVYAVMKHGGVKESTAKRYVRAAVKAAAEQADNEIARLRKEVGNG